MKNFINSSLKKKMQNYLLMVVCIFTTMNLVAQVSVTITSPSDGASYCAELENTAVMFDATGMDGATVISGASIGWHWEGPNGFVSNIRNPMVTFNNVLKSGEYRVTATFTSGETARDTVDITVENLFTKTCPTTPIIVTPNTADAECIKSLTFPGVNITSVNCTNLAYTWNLTLRLDGITPFAAENLPMPRDIANGAVGAVYGAGVLYDTLPFGFHKLRFDLLSGGNIIDNCLIDVQVIESRNNLACNDLINLTLNSNCEAIVTPDMILQGDYCFDLFGINMVNEANGATYSNIGSLVLDAPGLYTVTITGQTGLSCWGQIRAEDKSVPILECSDIEMYCSEIGSIKPGDIIRGFARGRVLDDVVVAGNTEDFDFTLDNIFGTVSDVILNFEADIDVVSDLEIRLISPEGTELLLADLDDIAFVSVCDGNNINVCLADNGILSYAMFGSAVHCRGTQNAFIGSFRPKESFSGLDGESVDYLGSQLWTVRVTNDGLTDMDIIDLDLQVYTVEGNILGPADVVQNAGCSDGQNIVSMDEQEGTNCEDGYWEIINRTWTVTNDASGLSSSCTHRINLKQWTLDEILWPKSYDDLDQEVLDCEDLDASDFNNLGVPLPSVTGTPRVPFGEICGNFEQTYTDLTFNICGPTSKKTIRTWSVLDWCTGDIATYAQTIKVVDRAPIILSCVPDNIEDMIASDYDEDAQAYFGTADPYTCSGSWVIQYPLVFENQCDDALTIEVFYLLDNDDDPTAPPVNGAYTQKNVVDINGNSAASNAFNGVGHRIINIPVGRRAWIRFEATDECGNKGVCFTEVDIRDDIDPNPICIEFTVVTIGQNGHGRLPAESLDNGSWDNCGVVDYKVRLKGIGVFVDTLQFSCACQLPNRMVTLQVTDAAGNTNICHVEVQLQDNIPAINLSTPQQSYTFDCGDSPLDLSSIIEETIDKFAYIDNCQKANNGNGVLDLTITVENLTDAVKPFEFTGCGTGSRVVKYLIVDECGNQMPSFVQTFTYFNSSLINPGIFDVQAWPQAVVNLTNCTNLAGLEPENLSSNQNADAIRVRTGECNDIAIGWDDRYFPDVTDACLKIIRTWTVIDWCIASGSGGLAAGSESFDQIIKIDDSVPPSIDVTSVFVMNSNSSTCLTATDTTALVAIITDECTDMFPNQEVDYYFQIEYPDGTKSSIFRRDDANGSYPFGTSIITWTAEDHCGNIQETITRVVIRDTKKPTPYCLGSVVTATMSNGGSVQIWASDFDLGGTDNYTGNAACNNFNELKVYFKNGNQQVQSLSFDCDDIPNGISQMIPLQVYYEDEAGNSDFCIVFLDLQDNASNICEDDAGSRIEGNVRTLNSEMLENVRIDVRDNYEFENFTMTDQNGNYAFNVLSSKNYELKATMNDDPLNGVSTLDLVLIQRHILGLEPLDSPYKMIAADADNSGGVTAIDLLTIRKLILGVINEYPNGQESWRFPDENQTFVDPNKPFPYREQIEIFNLIQNMVSQDLMGVKIGDVNLSAEVNAQGNNTEVESRGQATLNLEVENVALSRGESVIIPIYARDMNDIVGFQNTISFDPNVMTFLGIQAEALDMGDENIGLISSGSGDLSLSWNSIDGTTLASDIPLFNLEFDIHESAMLSDVMTSSSSITKSEAYNGNLEIMNVDISFRGEESSELVLYQNIPNPFMTNTDVRFSLPYESDVVFTVFDMNGRVLLKRTNAYSAGNHTITLSRNELESSGVMYYKIEANSGTASKKMIQIR